jgi:hypothetical protein
MWKIGTFFHFCT